LGSSLAAHSPPAWYDAIDAVLDTDLTTTTKLLLVALIVRAGLKPDGTAYPSLKTLARQLGIGHEKRDRDARDRPRDVGRHVRRLLKTLETRELVERNERPGTTNEYRIRWDRLLHPGHWCPGSDMASTSDPGHPCPPTPDTDDRSGRTPMSAHPGRPCPPNIPLNSSQQPSPSTGRGWRDIEKQLRDEGVHEWCQAVRLARENGCRPSDIQAVIFYFREHRDAWESPAGALYRRITNATPDQRADDLATWLPMKPAFVRRQKESQQRMADEKRRRLAELPRDEARALLIWGIDNELVSSELLDTFDSDPQFQLWPDKQNLLASLMVAHVAATKPTDATAQPPPHNRAQKRTQHSSHAASGSAETAPAIPNRDHSTRIMP